ncbi:MAG: radical SAM protein [archaeon]
MKVALISTSTYPSDQGIRHVSSMLKAHKHDVKVFFLPEAEDYSKKYHARVLSQLHDMCKGFDIIGISSYASTSVRAVQIINSLKPLNKPIIWGGIHATISPDKCIEHVDLVCVGEGELTMLELLDHIEKKKDITNIANLWVRKDGKLHKNEIRKLVEDLDSLPPPDYDIEDHYILEKNRIIPFEERHLNGMIFFQTERGCPNACAYCSNIILRKLCTGKGKAIRFNSIDYAIKEMARLKSKFKTLGVFDLRDETLFVRPLSDFQEFCRRYKKEVGIRFKCLADPPTMNEEKLALLVDAGLTDIIIGIQGSERVNFEIYKRFITDAQVIRAAAIVNKFKDKVAVMYDVITTNPYEEKEDILNLINLLIALPKPYYLSVNNLVFFFGTPLYEKAIADRIIRTKRDSAFHLNYWDRWKHIKLKRKNAYLNLVLNLMRGPCTSKRYGLMPYFILKHLIKPKMVDFNLKHRFPTYFVGFFVQIFDFGRENIAKPLFRAMPISFKVWYDRVRYRV